MSHNAMEPSNKEGTGASRVILIVILVVVALALGWFGRGWFVGEPAPELAETEAPPPPPAEELPPIAAEGEGEPAEEPAWARDVRRLAGWPAGSLEADVCTQIEEGFERVCAARGGAAFCADLRSAVGELAGSPPRASGEIKDPEAVVANALHLARVLGRRDLVAWRDRLVGARDQERSAFELYRWVVSREACGAPRGERVSLDTQNDYAVFLLGTLGGQAYLARRAPRVEALASLYALLTVDRADRARAERHGFDPRDDIARTRALVEGGGLEAGEAYLALLDEIEARWSSR